MEGARLTRCALTADRCQIASRRADPVQVETLTPQQVRRVCPADSVSALASDPQTVGADPRLAGMVCDLLHPYIHYYSRAAVLACPASGVALVSGIGAGRPGACIRSSVVQAVL